MQKFGCNLTIGTNNVMINSPDIFREMDYLWKVTMGMSQETDLIQDIENGYCKRR